MKHAKGSKSPSSISDAQGSSEGSIDQGHTKKAPYQTLFRRRRNRIRKKSAPRRPRTRAYVKKHHTDRVALFPDKKGYVMLWEWQYEYSVVSIEQYAEKYSWEGPQIGPRSLTRNPDLNLDTGLFFVGADHEKGPGTWPWRAAPLPEEVGRCWTWNEYLYRMYQSDQEHSWHDSDGINSDDEWSVYPSPD